MRQMIGQNPNAAAIQAAAQAHIAEHLAFAYRQRMEDVLGVPLPPPDVRLPEDVEVELSRVAAQASQIVLGRSQTQIAAEQAQQAANDPITQIQQRELALKEAEIQRKAKKDIVDAAAKADQLEVEKERIKAQAEIEGARLGLEAAKAKEELEGRYQSEGMRLGVEISRAAQEKKQKSEDKKPPTQKKD